jgi:hypothetical protein
MGLLRRTTKKKKEQSIEMTIRLSEAEVTNSILKLRA